jgi:DNA-binding beta-propeller fold protein YncE
MSHRGTRYLQSRRALPALVLALLLALTAPAAASSGTWERAWGKNVIQTGKPGDLGDVAEICTVAADCQQGLADGGGAGQFASPNGVAADASGNVYVADSGRNRIQKFDSSGNFLLTWGKDVIATNLGTGFEICTVAPDCQAGAPSTGLGGELNFPRAIAVDPASGNVYVADINNNRIQEFDSSGNFLRTWGRDVIQSGKPGDISTTAAEICTVAADCKAGITGTLGGELDTPVGVAADGSGNVYVGEYANNRISKFTSTGVWDRSWGKDVVTGGVTGFEICTTAGSCKQGNSSVSLGGELGQPQGIAADAAGNTYVANFNGIRIEKFDSSGNFLRAWGKDVIQSGKPGDLGTGLEICTAAADCQQGAASTGAGGELSSPAGVAADGAGGVYVSDFFGERIEKYDSSGTWLRTWGKDVIQTGMPGDLGSGFEICTVTANCQNAAASTGLGGELDQPTGVGSDPAGSVYVADARSAPTDSRIDKFAADPVIPPAGGGGGSTPTTTAPTGQRAAAIKKCKKKFPKGPRRKRCIRHANQLPV